MLCDELLLGLYGTPEVHARIPFFPLTPSPSPTIPKRPTSDRLPLWRPPVQDDEPAAIQVPPYPHLISLSLLFPPSLVLSMADAPYASSLVALRPGISWTEECFIPFSDRPTPASSRARAGAVSRLRSRHPLVDLVACPPHPFTQTPLCSVRVFAVSPFYSLPFHPMIMMDHCFSKTFTTF